MANVWIEKANNNKNYYMPVFVDDDRQVEFDVIKGDHIDKLRDYWTYAHKAGFLNRKEYSAIQAVIDYQLLHPE